MPPSPIFSGSSRRLLVEQAAEAVTALTALTVLLHWLDAPIAVPLWSFWILAVVMTGSKYSVKPWSEPVDFGRLDVMGGVVGVPVA